VLEGNPGNEDSTDRVKDKQEISSQLEPLQEQTSLIIMGLEEEKTRMAQAHSKSATLLQEKITT
jgi:hypothetical protein